MLRVDVVRPSGHTERRPRVESYGLDERDEAAFSMSVGGFSIGTGMCNKSTTRSYKLMGKHGSPRQVVLGTWPS